MRARGTRCLAALLLLALAVGVSVRTAARAAEEPEQVTFSGLVVGPDGAARPNVLVEAYYQTVDDSLVDKRAVGEVRTDAAGRFTYAMPADHREWPGQVDIYVSKEGLALGWSRWSLDRDVEATITLEEPVRLAGTVVDEAGSGVEGAEVRALLNVLWFEGDRQRRAQVFGVPPFNRLAVRTDAAGRFALGNIPPGARAELLVAAPGRATAVTGEPLGEFPDLQYSAGQEDIRIVLPREAIVRGTVVSKDDGSPVEGQELEVWLHGPGFAFARTSCVSAEDGRFKAGGLCSGIHGIGLATPGDEPPEWVAAPMYVKTTPGQATDGVTIELSRGGMLDIEVTDAISGQPIEAARVMVDAGRHQDFQAQTDADGKCRFRVLAGKCRVNVGKKDYKQPDRHEVEVAEGATSSLAVGLMPLPEVKGVVLDPAGEPVAGALVRIGTHGPPARTDAAGRFEVGAGRMHCDEDYVFTLLVLHRQRGLARVIDLADGPQTVQITLLPARIVVGRVVDGDKKPVPGAKITVAWQRAAGYADYGEPLTADAEGRYRVPELPGLPPGQSFYLSATADGYGRDRTQVFLTESQPGQLEAADLVLARADLSVSGIVVDEEGKPVANAMVGTYGEGQPNRTVQTDGEGRFKIDKLCAGQVTLYMPGSPGRSAVDVDAGAADVRLVRRSVPWSTVPVLDTSRLP